MTFSLFFCLIFFLFSFAFLTWTKYYSHAGGGADNFNRRPAGGKTSLTMRRSDLLLSSNSLMNIRRKPDEKRRQKEDKYFFNSVMERQRRKPRPTSAICKNFPGLSKKQLELCFRYPDVMSAAIGGLQLAVNECQFQFQKHRWNCSALERKNRNPHSSNFLQKGNDISTMPRIYRSHSPRVFFLVLVFSRLHFLRKYFPGKSPFHITGYTILYIQFETHSICGEKDDDIHHWCIAFIRCDNLIPPHSFIITD